MYGLFLHLIINHSLIQINGKMSDLNKQTALGDVAARQLAIATRTVPQMVAITPRWLTHLLNWRIRCVSLKQSERWKCC
jgi:hypothetical protein